MSKGIRSKSFTGNSLTYMEFVENICKNCSLCEDNSIDAEKHFCFKHYSTSPLTFISETFPVIRKLKAWPVTMLESEELFEACFCNKSCLRYEDGSCTTSLKAVWSCLDKFRDQIYYGCTMGRRRKRKKARRAKKSQSMVKKQQEQVPAFIFGGSKQWCLMCEAKNESNNT